MTAASPAAIHNLNLWRGGASPSFSGALGWAASGFEAFARGEDLDLRRATVSLKLPLGLAGKREGAGKSTPQSRRPVALMRPWRERNDRHDR
jgi:hypothetical protein